MNTDIRLNTTILSDPKIRKLIRKKGHEGFFNLISLWIHTAQHNCDGKLSGMDNDDIMDASGTNDEDFVSLLLDLKLLLLKNKTYEINKWAEHQQWAMGAKTRSETAKIAAKARWEKNASFSGENHGNKRLASKNDEIPVIIPVVNQ